MKRVKKEKEDQLKGSLKAGDTVTGTVSSIQKFGLFVDLGGVEALVPRSEISWSRNSDPSDYKTGDSVTAKVIDLDWDNNRLTLSIKKTQGEPWDMIDQFSEGSTVNGTVTNLINTGAFVELKPGLEGFIHISRMSLSKRINRPEDVLSKGDSVSVRVIGINRENQKISLELLTDEADPWQASGNDLLEGVHTGIVESVRGSGAHIRLSNGMLGFAPKERLTAKGVDVQKEFPVGSEVRVAVIEMDRQDRKIILSVKDAEKKQEQEDFKKFSDRHSSSGGSTLGDLFKDKFEELQKKVDK